MLDERLTVFPVLTWRLKRRKKIVSAILLPQSKKKKTQATKSFQIYGVVVFIVL